MGFANFKQGFLPRPIRLMVLLESGNYFGWVDKFPLLETPGKIVGESPVDIPYRILKVQALTGDWRAEYLFQLKQDYEVYNFFQVKIAECDREIENLLNERLENNERVDGEARLKYNGKKKQVGKNEPKVEFQKIAFQLTGGIDISLIPGVSSGTIMALLSETGVDLSEFPTAKHFASWLRLAPNKKISGGKVLSSRTVKGKSRLADAFRHAANAVGNIAKEGSYHQFYLRIAYKKGKLAATTATARKIAVVVYNMLTRREEYKPLDQTQYLERVRLTQLKNMQKRINLLGVRPEELSFATC